MLSVAILCGGLALASLAGRGTAQAPTELSPVLTASGTRSVSEGRRIFSSSCSACHGTLAQGITGRAPSLHGVGALAADFYLQTGRMPLPFPNAEPLRGRPAFDQSQIRALIAYIASFGGPAIPVVKPKQGTPARGQSLFALNCAGCHTIQARGGIVTGAVVPALTQSTPTEIAEAIRIGPYVMPRFSAGEISEADIDSIVRYVQSTQHPEDRGGWDLGRLGPIPEGMVAWLLAIVALVLLARLLGERTAPRPPSTGSSL